MTDGVTKLIGMGYSHVCAMCEHMHRAASAGSDSCGKDCCGPIGGGAFPMYEGVMSRDAIARTCYACGSRANKLLSTPNGYIGSCDDHLRWISLSKSNTDPVESKVADGEKL